MNKNKPFFNNFIESQVEELTTEEANQCAGGFKSWPPGDLVTMKSPSDDDEGIDFPPMVTMKHPSDDDEGGNITPVEW
ncbi:microviridin/marinostatin family tricyclic proteinase inhibitor [Vibrio sp. Of7-15]|uniref:microviridin/marinostatin family tricyclic proteinase inhibitor n=1 Tax=Vibrio sp. Of7-15 TaxID=2724879 RepID=UPI001EF28EDD|nr:microviridin/marinostatin family tricyclic proteinase inhibitor [Vibrio sp. Of7-15]MCG7500170.1 microviridin/marinostatin family tricyclic proteinase inhibitor [Vibrio sp. Of7-15]